MGTDFNNTIAQIALTNVLSDAANAIEKFTPIIID